MKKVQYGILAFVMCATLSYKNAEQASVTNKNTENSPKNCPAIEIASQNEQVFEGTFDGIEQGDYAYFKVRGVAEDKSFMVLKGDQTYKTISANPEKFIGRIVKVYWVAAKQNIPEAGGMIDVEKYLRAVLLK